MAGSINSSCFWLGLTADIFSEGAFFSVNEWMNDFNFLCICFLLLCDNLPQVQWLKTTQMLLTSQFLWVWSPAPAELGPLLRELPTCHQVSGRTVVSSESWLWKEPLWAPSGGQKASTVVVGLRSPFSLWLSSGGHSHILEATCSSLPHVPLITWRPAIERVSLSLQSAKMESYVMQRTHGSEKTPSPLPYLAR